MLTSPGSQQLLAAPGLEKPEDVFTVRRYGDTRPQYGLA